MGCGYGRLWPQRIHEKGEGGKEDGRHQSGRRPNKGATIADVNVNGMGNGRLVALGTGVYTTQAGRLRQIVHPAPRRIGPTEGGHQ